MQWWRLINISLMAGIWQGVSFSLYDIVNPSTETDIAEIIRNGKVYD